MQRKMLAGFACGAIETASVRIRHVKPKSIGLYVIGSKFVTVQW
jgi:hypothetical protein